MNPIRFLTKLFFNFLYRVRPPKMVNYWKRADSAKAKPFTDKDGTYRMKIEGEEADYPGFPRGHVLTGSLAKLKASVKNMVFNQVFAEIEKMTEGMKHDMLPNEHCVPAVREIHRVMDMLVEMEVVPDMKARMKLIKRVLTFFLQEDDAYRFRAQFFLSEINQKKVALSEGDKYYARGKYWKVDYKKFDY